MHLRAVPDIPSHFLPIPPLVEAPSRVVIAEAVMGTNPGNDKSYLRDEGAVRRAAMMVVDEFGENAAAYAMTRAIVGASNGAVSPQ